MDLLLGVLLAVAAAALATLRRYQRRRRADPPPSDDHVDRRAPRSRRAPPTPLPTIRASDLPTADAPRPAWDGAERITSTFLSAVSGESFDNDDGSSRQAALAAALTNEGVFLEHDVGNRHSRSAVRVVLARSGIQVGYLPAEHRLMADVKAGTISARVYQVMGGTPDKPTRGVVLQVFVWAGPAKPKPRRRKKASPSA